MMTQSTCYRGTKTMDIKGILWHSTGANNPWLKRYVQPDDNASDKAALLEKIGNNAYSNDWNHTKVQAGLNSWIGKLADGTVATVQTMPWDYRPWGCGSGNKGSCNTGWIQFKICEDGLTDADYFSKVYEEACELTAYLCKLYNINPKGSVSFNGVTVPTILCHADSYKLGLGSNHGDALHWFPKFGKSMETARNDVAPLISGSTAEKDTSNKDTKEKDTSEKTVIYRVRKSWSDSKTQKGAYKILANAKKCADANQGYKVFDADGKVVYTPTSQTDTATSKDVPFLVRVKISNLNIRTGASTDHPRVQFCPPGTYTIVETRSGVGSSSGWGRLKSNLGWLALDFVERV